jgi:glutamyl-Q tRNA(Asp) synthetase
MLTTRFAPSPTGPLHLGHALSALTAHDFARVHGGAFLLRFEDIDRARSRPEWEAAILADLAWLGIRPDAAPVRQSERQPLYDRALDRLWSAGLLYPCHCSRGDIRAAIAAPQEGPVPVGPDGLVYPGTCRNRPRTGPRPDAALRLDIRRAVARTGDVAFRELSEERTIRVTPATLVAGTGDVVLARRGIGTSYHLSVVVDDAEQQISHVVRGRDLFEATAIHVVLQRLLGLPVPEYLHHRLVRDADGRRLAKRHDARAIAAYRDAGASPADLRRMVGLGVRDGSPAAA